MENWVYTYLLLAVIVCGAAWSLYKVQKDPTVSFNMLDLLIENGRVSKVSCTFMGSFLLTCWIMLDLQFNGKMSENYLTIFGGLWVAPLITRVIFNKSNPTPTDPEVK